VASDHGEIYLKENLGTAITCAFMIKDLSSGLVVVIRCSTILIMHNQDLILLMYPGAYSSGYVPGGYVSFVANSPVFYGVYPGAYSPYGGIVNRPWNW